MYIPHASCIEIVVSDCTRLSHKLVLYRHVELEWVGSVRITAVTGCKCSRENVLSKKK